jgi:hypothetical protein
LDEERSSERQLPRLLLCHGQSERLAHGGADACVSSNSAVSAVFTGTVAFVTKHSSRSFATRASHTPATGT